MATANVPPQGKKLPGQSYEFCWFCFLNVNHKNIFVYLSTSLEIWYIALPLFADKFFSPVSLKANGGYNFENL
jgi:hypothetical protein